MERSPFFEAIELMRLHQQRSRFVGNAYGTTLSLNEAYLLIEIDVDPRVTLTALRKMLGLERSLVSRSVKRLMRGGYLRGATSSTDRRTKQFQVTAKGKAFLKLHDQENNSFVADHLARLSIGEVAELQKFQHLICDAVGAAPVRLRASEHPFTNGIRRITRGLGFNGSSLFQSGYSSTAWQILAAIAYAPAGGQLSQLAVLLGMHISTLSQWIARYIQSGLIKQERSPVDGRARALSLTERGMAVLQHIESCGERLLERAFAPLPPEAPSRFVAILAKHLGVRSTDPSFVLRGEVRIEQISSPEARREARGFLIFHLTRTLRYLDAPEVLIGSGSVTFILRQGSRISAVCELIPGPERAVVMNFACDEGLALGGPLPEFVDAVLAEMARTHRVQALLFAPSMLPKYAQELLRHKVMSSGEILIPAGA